MTRFLTFRTAVVFAALVLGVGGGFLTAVVAPIGGTTTSDPLHLGVPLVEQPCSSDFIMVLGSGDTTGALAQAVAANAGSGVKYLKVTSSCSALYTTQSRDPGGQPDYVVYTGPEASPNGLCGQRMTPEHRGDYVTRLSDSTDIFVKCVCPVYSMAPTLTPRDGGVADPDEAVWIRGLQSIFHDATPPLLTNAQATGYYNPATVALVEQIQATIPNHVVDGVVDQPTWQQITRTYCGHYNY